MGKILKGFTLVEVLVGVGLFSLLAVTMTTLVTALLKSARKAEAVTLVKGEGEYALSAMVNMVRFSSLPVCSTAGGGKSLTVQKRDSISYRYYATPSPNYPQHLSSESGTMVTPLTSNRVVMTECGVIPIFTCAADESWVDICFWLDSAVGIDSSEKAGAVGTAGMQFRTRVFLRN